MLTECSQLRSKASPVFPLCRPIEPSMGDVCYKLQATGIRKMNKHCNHLAQMACRRPLARGADYDAGHMPREAEPLSTL